MLVFRNIIVLKICAHVFLTECAISLDRYSVSYANLILKFQNILLALQMNEKAKKA